MAKRVNKKFLEEELRDSDIKFFENNPTNNVLKKSISIQDINFSKIKCLNETQKQLKKSILDKDLIIATGAAGTGKSYQALASALQLMKADAKYKKLILVKSVTQIPGEELGYLKGSLTDKTEPYMYSYTMNLDKLFGGSHQITKSFFETGVIEFQPIAFCRGVTFGSAVVIVDEIQNITMSTFKTLITRIGFDCKMIFLGDKDQIDIRNKQDSCINKVIELFKDKGFIDVIQFRNDESVRHSLIPEIIDIIENGN